MKSTETFKKTISEHLEKVGATDSAFAEKLKNSKKNIDDCITYILNTVKKSGCVGFADDEIFGMALHYYDEEKIEVGKPINAKVVVNHTVDLSEEEISQAKEKALNDVIAQAKEKMLKKKTSKKEEQQEAIQGNLF